MQGVRLSSFLETNTGPGQRTLSGFLKKDANHSAPTPPDRQGWKQTFLDRETRQELARHMAALRASREGTLGDMAGQPQPELIKREMPWSGESLPLNLMHISCMHPACRARGSWGSLGWAMRCRACHSFLDSLLLKIMQSMHAVCKATQGTACYSDLSCCMLASHLNPGLPRLPSLLCPGSEARSRQLLEAADPVFAPSCAEGPAQLLESKQYDLHEYRLNSKPHMNRILQRHQQQQQEQRHLEDSKTQGDAEPSQAGGIKQEPRDVWPSLAASQAPAKLDQAAGFKHVPLDSWQPETASQVLKRQRTSAPPQTPQQHQQQQDASTSLHCSRSWQDGVEPHMQPEEDQTDLKGSQHWESISEQACADVLGSLEEAGEPDQEHAWAEPPAGMGLDCEEGGGASISIEQAAPATLCRTWACQVRHSFFTLTLEYDVNSRLREEQVSPPWSLTSRRDCARTARGCCGHLNHRCK